jgi:hypothetical protein
MSQTSSTNTRSGNKWNVNELLNLQREYELLELTVQEIAVKHKRSVNSILYKLESEGFIQSWNEARGFDSVEYENSFLDNVVVSQEMDISDSSDEVNDLYKRINDLETYIYKNDLVLKDIESIVKKIGSILEIKCNNIALT